MNLSNMIKELIEPKDLLLSHRIESCSYKLDRKGLSELLRENMLHYNGVGLSANHIGIWERAFVMMTNIEKEETITCFNPKIVNTSLWKELKYTEF